ncbi:hypothetical protein PENANT_c018G04386 [Penicillium antarcticum]|uniref:Zn(2)-C6 fungal-type domain-containing protein n=1 Tax=Penicillium antarcticum TaxID=416450 RepID=A0A1V6Q1Q3_9EURO|nr:hypothetical protein PENANT_c018G04386 [Penicillium antarcticum]
MSGSSSESQKSTPTPPNGVEGKIAIPRLPNELPEINPFRTISACSSCREKKAKCDGGRPRCQNCTRLDRACTYTGSKRDNQKLQLVSLQRKVEVYEELLGEIISQAKINQNVSVKNIIKKHCTASPELFSDILRSESLTRHHVQVPNSRVSLGQMYIESMSDDAKLKRPITKDPPVQVKSIQHWTSIVENDTASHLLSFYFTWENPTWNLIDLETFVQDLETHHPGRYCSRLLVHVLLFFGCSFSYRLNRITDRREEKGIGQKLYDQIQLLWESDKGTPDLPTIQSGILLGLLSCTFGIDRLGTQFIMNGAKLYLQSSFDTVERCSSEHSEKKSELSSAELSQEMVSWAIFDVQALASQVYRKVSHWSVPPPQRCSAEQAAKLDENMEWKPYPFDYSVTRPNYYTTLRYRSALAALVNEIATFSLRLTGNMTKDDQKYCYKLYERIVTWRASLPPTILPENNTTPHILCLHFYHQATLISLSTLFTTKANPTTDPNNHQIDFDHVKSEAMETIGSLILVFKHRHGWKSIPIVMLHYFCLGGVHATTQLDAHNPKWALVLESCVVGLWHMSLGWGRLCKAFLRTIELVLKSSDPDPSLVPIKVTAIFEYLNSEMWSATDLASLSADYVVQRVPSKANAQTAGTVSHQTLEDLIRAMENL